VRSHAKRRNGTPLFGKPRISGVISKVRQGDPDPDQISTSLVERQNLTMRMAMRRFTRLTNHLQQKVVASKSGCRLALRALQPMPRAFKPENHSGNGSGFDGSGLGDC
jgi:hypothetical protein